MSRFKDLMECFLADRITRKERHELFDLIRCGHHLNELGDGFMKEVKNRSGESKTLQFITEEIFASLAQEYQELVPDKVPPIHKPTISWWKIAAAAMLTLAVGVTLHIYRLKTELAEGEQPVTVSGATTASHIFSGKKYLRLPDGSKVILNAGSELRYDDSFGISSRDVLLAGEAYFDIRHDASRPFKVHTGKVMTTVRGTAFNVKAHAEDNEVTITVQRGQVDVGDREQTYETITTNEQIAVNTNTYDFVKTSVDAGVPLAWKSPFIILDGVTLEEAAALISAHYHVKVTLANDRLRQCRITSTFLDNEKLYDVLDVISTAVNATFTMQGDDVMIHGKGCNTHERSE